VELQYNQSPEALISQYQLYGFYDLGRVWNEDPIAGNEASHASLSSTGLGARFNIADALSGGVEGSLPLTKDVGANGTDGAAPRIFFNLLYRY
jgi:hemolysin activation/secretion protein